MSDAPDPLDWLPDTHWGTAETPLPPVLSDADDPDYDDEMPPGGTPPDVIAILGFDPATDPDCLAMDASWREDQHPRADDGKFGKGGGGSGKTPREQSASMAPAKRMTKLEPHTNQGSKALKTIHEIASKGLGSHGDAGKAADEIKKMVSGLAHPTIESYANRVLRYLESHHGLDDGELGQAVRKKDKPPETEKKIEPPSKPPPPAAKTDPPKPPKAEPAPPPPKATGTVPTIAEIVAAKGKSSPVEANWHRITWKGADDVMRQAIANTRSVPNILRKGTTSAYYQPGAHDINMAKYKPQDERGASVWRHEFGHAMDYNGATTPRSYRHEEDRRADLAEYMKANPARLREDVEQEIAQLADSAPDEIKQKAERFTPGIYYGNVTYAKRVMAALMGSKAPEAVMSVAKNHADRLMLRDFMGAMTHNAIGGGHSNGYYTQQRTRHCSEMFANYVSLTAAEDGDTYREILHRVAPRACKGFDAIIAETAGGKSA